MDALTLYTRNPAETIELGRSVGECVQTSDVLLLTGELGAGKTCLSGGVAAGLGLGPEVVVTSPTYNLMLAYAGGRLELYHFDLYRLESAEQLYDLDFFAYAGVMSQGVALVEWGDKFAEVVAAADLELRLTVVGDDTRRIELRALRQRGEELAREVFARYMRARADYADE
ncbi:MAG: tRNA (adenosine(37)-N6)-threonylcarbamoyltransferase complex ATPase subunit type 1 TsaE [Actinomycetes bacterium]|jgi:tRNA threonylcarbamoyladenosine biosynthesis protein TsaE|nr:tRNA (adenosine(37)-N6)-threonylcarbamoyltransferase complex ATPase subunit type 1 TsaE [Actinomycetes bacterium]